MSSSSRTKLLCLGPAFKLRFHVFLGNLALRKYEKVLQREGFSFFQRVVAGAPFLFQEVAQPKRVGGDQAIVAS